MKELESEKDGEVFHLLFHFPDGCNAWGWTSLKAGARTFTLSLTWVSSARVLLPFQQDGSEPEVEPLGLESVPIWLAGAAGTAPTMPQCHSCLSTRLWDVVPWDKCWKILG